MPPNRRGILPDNVTKVLIKEVKKRGCLWDPDDDRYNDRYFMARGWSEISELLKLPEDTIRGKWKNLRDLFKKEIKRYGNVQDYTGKWRHFEALTFLQTESKVTENNDENSCEEVETITKEEYIELDAEEVNETENEQVQVFFDETYDDDGDPLPDKRPKLSDDDYDLMFLKSLAPYFNQLEPIRKLVVRSKMQDMLLNEIAAQSSSQFHQLKKKS